MLATNNELNKGVVSRATARGLPIGLRTRKIAKIGGAMHTRAMLVLSRRKKKLPFFSLLAYSHSECSDDPCARLTNHARLSEPPTRARVVV